MEKTKISSELFDLLNAALSRELEVSVQYMLQHTMWAGKTSMSKSEEKISKPTNFVAIEEEVPSSTLGASIREILEIDRDQEKSAIELYKRIIEMATKEGDDITAKMFKKILRDEERHHKTFSNMLGMISI
jgi:bacterioferritin